ncbi:MAG: hypothetical protein ACRDUB_06205, partial [Mycobacterium sp.]
MSAWAGAANPTRAAANPVATMLANPNFFISKPFRVEVGYRFGVFLSGLLSTTHCSAALISVGSNWLRGGSKWSSNRSIG